MKTMATVIETHDLWRIYHTGEQEVAALRGANLRVERGRFVALKGRSGSGKTTLLNCVGGLDRPTRGTVQVLGQELTDWSDEQLTRWRREQLGFVFQSFGLITTLSVYENVELMTRLRRLPAKERHRHTVECLERVGLGKWHDHRPDELSGGQQQRVAIARALANNAPLMLADEPTGELDSVTAAEILNLFRRIVDEEDVTLLIVSHDQLVDDYADEVLHLQDGRVVGDGG
ncbi:MAG: ABC transporter ATP-binding protein [Anaerolineae bacterium]|nr:ABC transporter ATP-binding protein [Anaerolineae bacterium]